jgi:hypothetical protein
VNRAVPDPGAGKTGQTDDRNPEERRRDGDGADSLAALDDPCTCTKQSTLASSVPYGSTMILSAKS